jgi:5'-3' exonuclease
MELLIDADNIVFRCLKATEDQSYYSQVRACDFKLDSVLDTFGRPEYKLIFSGSGNFRKILDPSYKANRDPNTRPKYLHDAREYLVKYWGAEVAHGEEADDAIARLQSDETVMVVNDHDYLQVGGKIYNPWKNEMINVTTPEFYFWRQCLTGCKNDNVPGLKNPEKAHFKNPPNFTEDTASKVLEGKSPEEMKETVQNLYKQVMGDEWFARYDLTARLLFLRRKDAVEYYQIYG